MNNLLERYLREEPNSEYVQEIRNLDPSELQDRLQGQWRFGTAGFRAKMEAGYMRLNRVSVAKIAYSLGTCLPSQSKIAIGFDGRHHSQEYALLVAQILEALGHESFVFSKMTPTPLVAFSVTQLEAAAGVMITASHNPPQDNGIKIYGSDGAQLVAPATKDIETILDQAPAYQDIIVSTKTPKNIPDSVIDSYFGNLTLNLSPPIRERLKIIYTPMHGVGEIYALRALKEAGFDSIEVVASQAKPDGDFPTVKFPNPEEPGALDEAKKLSAATNADLILANDPDADRLAVCIGTKALTGNEIGVLLGNYLIENYQGNKKPLVMSTVVSSRMLSKIAKAHQVSYAETLTGFANIAHTALEREKQFGEEFLFGYEEALGYCIGNHVRDKDGISAAVLFAQLFADLKSEHKTVWQKLEELALSYGLHQNLSWSVRGDLKTILARAENLEGFEKQKSLYPGLLLYTGEHDLRLIIRPSGTEPKIKFYAEVIGHPDSKKELESYLAHVQAQTNA
ncbi:MAG: phospho-sugar mutase [Myxococcaceae bacterium]